MYDVSQWVDMICLKFLSVKKCGFKSSPASWYGAFSSTLQSVFFFLNLGFFDKLRQRLFFSNSPFYLSKHFMFYELPVFGSKK